MNDIIAGTMQWCGKSTSQPTNKGYKKRDMGQIKKRKPTPKQYPSRRRNKMQRMKTRELIYAVRVKQIPERATGSDKPEGNGKHMKARKAMDSYGSGACT